MLDENTNEFIFENSKAESLRIMILDSGLILVKNKERFINKDLVLGF
jgi:hypothetical protein